MNKLNQEYLFMFLKVRNHHKANELVLNAIPFLENEYLVFNQKVDVFMNLLAKSTADNSGITLDKAEKRKVLVTQVVDIKNKIFSYCLDSNDEENGKLVGKSNSFYIKSSDEDLLAQAIQLQEVMLPLAPNLLPYGIGATELAAFDTAISNFAQAMPQVNLAMALKKDCNVLVKSTQKEILDLLKSKIDIKLRSIELSNNSVYSTYKSARALDVSGSRKSPDFEGSVMGNEVVLMANLPYNTKRTFRVNTKGGDAMWGLSTKKEALENGILIKEGDNPIMKSSSLGKKGNFLLIKSVYPEEATSFKVWVYVD